MGDAERLSRLVRQHAETSGLLGVPFVPAYRGSVGSRGSIVPLPASETEPKPGELQADGSKAEASDGTASVAAGDRPVAVEQSESATEGGGGGSALFGGDEGGGLADAPVHTRGDAERAAGGVAIPEEVGSKADRLGALRARYDADEPHAAFETAHTSIVFGEGDPDARLMFVGEAPGADEDRLGRPFVGKSGQLLEKMIVAMGLSREAVYIANVLKTRPPGNRTPTVEEARVCAPYLYEQIRIIAPEVIVTLGKSAGQLLLGTGATMGAMRGKWAAFPPETPLVPVDAGFPAVAVMPTYHPAYLLRSYTAENRAAVWSDLKQVMDRLGLGG